MELQLYAGGFQESELDVSVSPIRVSDVVLPTRVTSPTGPCVLGPATAMPYCHMGCYALPGYLNHNLTYGV